MAEFPKTVTSLSGFGIIPNTPFERSAEWYQQLLASGPPAPPQTSAARLFSLDVLNDCGRNHPATAAAWLRSHWQAGGREMLQEILKSERYHQLNMEMLLPFLNEPGLDFKKAAQTAGFYPTGKPDFYRDTFRTISEIRNVDIQRELGSGFVKNGFFSSREELQAALFGLPEGPLRSAGESEYATLLAINDPFQAVEWLMREPRDPELINRILPMAVSRGFSGSEAVPQLVKLALTEDANNAAGPVPAITRALVADAANSGMSIAFVNALPEGPRRTEAERALATALPVRDPVAASRWINALPESAWFRDDAAANLAVVLKDDPEAAAAWAASIRDPAKRETVLATLSKRKQQ